MPLSDKMPSEAQSVSDGIFMGSIYYLRRNDAARVLLVVIWHQNKKPALKEKSSPSRLPFRLVSLDYDFGEPAAEIFAFVGNAQDDLECCIGVDSGDGRVFVEQLCRRPSVHCFAYGQT